MGVAGTVWDPQDPNVLADPYPTYARLREIGPVVACADGSALVVRRAAVELAHRHPFLSSAPDSQRARRSPLGQTFIAMDAPHHPSARRLTAPAFRSGLDSITAAVRQRAADRLRAVGTAEVDAVAEIARPLALEAITDLMALPPTDVHELARLGDRVLQSDASWSNQPAHHETGDAASDLWSYFARWVAVGGHEGSVLGRHLGGAGDELTAALFLLFLAGVDTSTGGIASLLLCASRFPTQFAQLSAAMIAPAIDEVLRFETPVHFSTRSAIRDVDLDGHTIPAGSKVVLGLASANRDCWPAITDEFEVARAEPIRHLAFGHGAHFCLGAPLARLHLHAVLTAMIDRNVVVRAHSSGRWRGFSFGLRTLTALSITLDSV